MKILKNLLGVALSATIALSAQAQHLAILSDVHITPGNASEPKLKEAVDEINRQHFDAVLMIGDLTNQGLDEELANVKSILDNIKHPLYAIPGNHELNWSQSACKTFFDLWGNDRFAVDMDSLYIVGISCGPYMKMGDGHIKQEDLHWLESTLAQQPRNKRILSINHYPLTEDLDNVADYLDVLNQFPVVAHINGHYHSWKSYQGGDIPCTMVRALDMGHGNYGYTIVDLDRNWIHIYDKQLGQEPKAKYAYALNTEHKAVKAERKAITVPEGFNIEPVWADSASVFTRLAFDDNNIYFGNSLGQAKAIDKHTGELKWTLQTVSSVFSRPVVLPKGKVAFPAADGIVVAQTKDGKQVKFLPSKEGPYVADGLVTSAGWIQGAYKRLEMRNPATGKLKWSYDSIGNYCQAAPTVDGNDIVFGAWDSYLRCVDSRNGQLKWKWNNGKESNMLGPGNVVPVVTAERVYIVAPDRFMTAINRETGETLWRNKDHRYRESLGHSEDLSRIYAKTMDGELVAVDATSKDFKELWTVDLGLGYDHAPCIVLEHNGIVYAGSRRGIITAVDSATRELLWSAQVGTSEINGMDLDESTGDLYISLIEGTIFRISQK